MLDFIFVVSILGLFGIGVMYFLMTNSKLSKILSIVVLVLFFVTAFFYGNLSEHSTNDVVISQIEIDAVYKSERNGNTIYYVKETGKDIVTCLNTVTVCKGNKNYVMKYEYPKMNDITDFFINANKTNYVLVVKDLNIKSLPILK